MKSQVCKSSKNNIVRFRDVIALSLSLSLRVANLARDVVSVNVRLLEKHVETSFVLSKRVACDPGMVDND